MDPTFKKTEDGNNVFSRRGIGLAALVLGVAMILVFGNIMILGDARVLSKPNCDVFSYSLARSEFVIDQLRVGNFALWCPSSFCGFPNFGGFQSGLAYPLNFPYLFMSAAVAINWSFILHTFLGGMFMYLWLGRQSLHRNACIAGALMFAFCAPFYLRAYAGHLMPHCTIIWIPLVFLAIDGLIARPTLGWLLLGTAAVAMELLGGYPQVLFYTAIAAGLYTLAKISDAPKLGKSLLLLVLMNVFMLGLTCVQWAAGLAMMDECVRKGGVPYTFAAMFSLPPENWLTLIRPGLFGDMESFPYWGRCYLWEMCLYFGTIGLFFAIVGLWHSRRRRILIVTGIILVMGVLAMGCHSPHFRFFYEHVPGFNMFRSNSKFIILLVVFLIFLSAHGMDMLFREECRKKQTVGMLVGGVVACVVLVAMMGFVKFSSADTLARLMAIPLNSREVYFDPNIFVAAGEVLKAAAFAVEELRVALIFLGALTVVLYLFLQWPKLRGKLSVGVVGLLAVELLLFAWQEHVSFPPDTIRMPQVSAFLKENLGAARILCPNGINLAMTMDGVSDLWGNGSDSVIRRYAEFMAFSQGDNPDTVTGYQTFRQSHPRFDMLRCKYFLLPMVDGSKQVVEQKGALPRFLLVSAWKVEAKRDAVFAAISRDDFDPRCSVLLERAPAGWPLGSVATEERKNGKAAAPVQDKEIENRQSKIEILKESTDWQEVEVTITKPAILLQTDLYTSNWHVYALPGSAQSAYELIPANYILRAIPLQAGTHRLRIEYRPAQFVIGKWVSLASLALFVGLVGWWIGRKL